MKLSFLFAVAVLWGTAGIVPSQAQMTILNGASFDSMQPFAPGSFATAFGQGLCGGTMTGTWLAPGRLPTELSGCAVTVNGMTAMLQYVSPGQINFIVPVGLAAGQATVQVNNGSGTINGSMMGGASGPGMFALNGIGMGEGAMLHGTLWRTGPFSVSTSDQATYVSIYVTGLDLAVKPGVTIGGMPAEVSWWGDAPGYSGLQQINIVLPASAAGVGRVPVMVTSNGQGSNVTFMHVLPTTAMMQGMPGWGGGMTMGENMRRGHEVGGMAFNTLNSTALVVDENDDAVRVLSLGSNSTLATITLPRGSQAQAIAVNAEGTLAAVTLSAQSSVALIDLTQYKLVATVGTGSYPTGVAFAGSKLLVANGGSGTVSVIDSVSRALIQTVNTGLGANGIAAAGNTAVVANMQEGTFSTINLTDYSVIGTGPAGGINPTTRPHPYGVAISATASQAVITTPMSNGFMILDLGSRNLTQVTTGGIGPGAVAINGNTAYIANQMTANITVADLARGTVVKTFAVDPGPVALAVDAARNRLLVLAEGTGTLDVVDLASFAIVSRIDAGSTEAEGSFTMPSISSIAPSTAAAGSKFVVTISGSSLQDVNGIEFHTTAAGMGGGMMGAGMGQEDGNIRVSDVQVNAGGTQITASIQIATAADAGPRQIRLETGHGEMMGSITHAVFTVTK